MTGLWRALTDFIAARSGNIAISAALLFPVLLAAAALIVDEAALYHQKRQLQAAVDLAAIHAAADPANALALAHRTLLDHGALDAHIPLAELIDPVSGRLEVVIGRYTPDPSLAVEARFIAGAAPANAVAVRLRTPGRLHFAKVFMDAAPDIGTQGLASMSPRAAFSIGSRLASLEDGLVNRVLGQLLGTDVALSLVGYDGLLGLDVGLFDFLDALAGRINLSAGTYGEVLGARVRLSDIAAALHLAASGSDPAALDLLYRLSELSSDGIFVEMARIIAADGLADIAVGEAEAGLAANLNALQMLTVSGLLADGQRQIQTGIGLGLPSASATVALIVGEPPQGAWYALGEPGSYVRTAQIRLRIDIALGPQGDLAGINLPVYAELAFAEAALSALTCPVGDPRSGSASLAVRPGIVRLALGKVANGFTDTRQPLMVSHAKIATVAAIAHVMARADVQSAAIDPQIVYFSHADIANGTVKTVSTATPLASLTANLVDTLDIRLEVFGGGGLIGGIVSGVVNTTLSAALNVLDGLLTPLAPALDSTLTTLFSMLGLSIGQADVRLNGLDCRAAALVG